MKKRTLMLLVVALLLSVAVVWGATITATWTENQSWTTGWSDATPADGQPSVATIDVAAGTYDCVIVQVEWDWEDDCCDAGACAADDYIDFNIGSSADSGTSDDTIFLFTQRVNAEGDKASEAMTFTICNTPYISINLDNQAGCEIDVLGGQYAGRTWDSS